MPEFRCQACGGASFPSQEALMQHNAAAHAQHQHFACQTCGAEFHSKAELMEHGQSAHRM